MKLMGKLVLDCGKKCSSEIMLLADADSVKHKLTISRLMFASFK